jgi:hypothetical protein
MTKRKDEKPSRLRWFCLDVDSFLEDPRMQHLTTREKSFWLMMITKSFRQGGKVVGDIDIISDNTGATEKEAHKLLVKLSCYGLLIPEKANDINIMLSPRMVAEHQKAVGSYQIKKESGKKGGETKAANRRVAELTETGSRTSQ